MQGKDVSGEGDIGIPRATVGAALYRLGDMAAGE